MQRGWLIVLKFKLKLVISGGIDWGEGPKASDRGSNFPLPTNPFLSMIAITLPWGEKGVFLNCQWGKRVCILKGDECPDRFDAYCWLNFPCTVFALGAVLVHPWCSQRLMHLRWDYHLIKRTGQRSALRVWSWARGCWTKDSGVWGQCSWKIVRDTWNRTMRTYLWSVS